MSENAVAKTVSEERSVTFTPFMGREDITISIGMVTKFLAKPTAQKHHPGPADAMKFLMLCKSRGLNPWEGDAYIIGFDSQDGPEFNLITAYQALLKRAEASPQYDGKSQGVIVLNKDGEERPLQGKRVPKDCTLIGAWCDVYRKDRARAEHQEVDLTVYDKGRSRWKIDPAGMIVKVACAAAMREAFPNSLAGMYIEEEGPSMARDVTAAVNVEKDTQALADRLTQAAAGEGSQEAEPHGVVTPDIGARVSIRKGTTAKYEPATVELVRDDGVMEVLKDGNTRRTHIAIVDCTESTDWQYLVETVETPQEAAGGPNDAGSDPEPTPDGEADIADIYGEPPDQDAPADTEPPAGAPALKPVAGGVTGANMPD